MKRTRILALIAALLAVSVGLVHAQSGGGYDLSWSTIDGGGTTFSTGGGYELGSTVGQPDAATLSGGGYSLPGGFWSGMSVASSTSGFSIYLPLVMR